LFPCGIYVSENESSFHQNVGTIYNFLARVLTNTMTRKIVHMLVFSHTGGGTPEKTEELIQQYSRSTNNKNGGEAAYDLARTKNALRDLRRKKR
jgi:deoxyxylulose-5-phosphate synthase